MMNILNGGKHAAGSTDFQEFMVMPTGAETPSPRPCSGAPRSTTSSTTSSNEAGYATTVGDEGGFAPSLGGNVKAIELILKALEKAGRSPGDDVYLALDPAVSELYDEERGRYVLPIEGKELTSDEMVGLCGRSGATRFPIISLEDGMDENDWEAAGALLCTAASGDRVQLVGDDLLVTNVDAHRSRHPRVGLQRAALQGQPDRDTQRELRRRRDEPPGRAGPWS